MKKNKHLDKIVSQALASSIKRETIDQKTAAQFVATFKKLPLEQSIYALNAFKKGLETFESQRTLTVYSPVELPQELIKRIGRSLNWKLEIGNWKFQIDSSLLAGFKFKIGDEVFDSSLRSTLESLKN